MQESTEADPSGGHGAWRYSGCSEGGQTTGKGMQSLILDCFKNNFLLMRY